MSRGRERGYVSGKMPAATRSSRSRIGRVLCVVVKSGAGNKRHELPSTPSRGDSASATGCIRLNLQSDCVPGRDAASLPYLLCWSGSASCSGSAWDVRSALVCVEERQKTRCKVCKVDGKKITARVSLDLTTEKESEQVVKSKPAQRRRANGRENPPTFRAGN